MKMGKQTPGKRMKMGKQTPGKRMKALTKATANCFVHVMGWSNWLGFC